LHPDKINGTQAEKDFGAAKFQQIGAAYENLFNNAKIHLFHIPTDQTGAPQTPPQTPPQTAPQTSRTTPQTSRTGPQSSRTPPQNGAPPQTQTPPQTAPQAAQQPPPQAPPQAAQEPQEPPEQNPDWIQAKILGIENPFRNKFAFGINQSEARTRIHPNPFMV